MVAVCRRHWLRGFRARFHALTPRANLIITSLSGDEAVQSVYEQLFAAQEVCL
jgi:hypothetical protein